MSLEALTTSCQALGFPQNPQGLLSLWELLDSTPECVLAAPL